MTLRVDVPNSNFCKDTKVLSNMRHSKSYNRNSSSKYTKSRKNLKSFGKVASFEILVQIQNLCRIKELEMIVSIFQ
jgi:hypothetical protein